MLPDERGDDRAVRCWSRLKNWRSEFRIAREGDAYQIAITNPNGLLGGYYVGTFHRGSIEVSGPLGPALPTDAT